MCADSVTVNYGWTKPEVGASATTWGTKLNADLDLIDAQVFANQTAIGKLNAGQFTSAQITVNKPNVAVAAGVIGTLNGVPRWTVSLGDGSSEGGSNAGSNFDISRYSDAGAYIDAPLSILRQTGQVIVQNAPTTPSSVATKAYVDATSFVGEMKMFCGLTAPPGWGFCFGQALSRTTYAALFAVIGTRFGAGDGSTTFNLPQLQFRAPFGWDGTTSAPWGMGASGGEATHILSVLEMPAHAHGVTDPTHVHGSGLLKAVGSGGGTLNITPGGSDNVAIVNTDPAVTNVSVQNIGGDGAHNNIPPYQAIGFIIRIQ